MNSLSEWLTVLESRHPVAIDMGLERVSAVWQALACPRPAPRLITVAGTNGKGSTTAYISSLLTTLGYRCGSYTSPHLFEYNERVQLAGVPVSDQDFIAAFERIEKARENVSLSYFEFGTLAAFDVMSRAGLDFAVLEVGLGGRLDAVNVIDPDCSVITPIGLDHQEYLGSDLESIGREKAGIIRPGKPVVIGDPNPPASVLKQALDQGALMLRLGHDFTITPGQGAVVYQQGHFRIPIPRPLMAGPHQVQNMATALAAVGALLPASLERPEQIHKALGSVRLPGRLQPLRKNVWVDVGHNPHAAAAIAETLKDLGVRAKICVLGMLRDKDAAAVSSVLDPQVDAWYCASLQGERGRSGVELAQVLTKSCGAKPIREFSSVALALSAAMDIQQPDELVLVFGSFLTAGEASAFVHSSC